MLRLKLSLLMLWRHFLIKKSLKRQPALWGSPLRFSSLKRLENVFVRGVRNTSWKKALSWTRRRNFSTSCLTENSSIYFGYRNKIQSLTEDGFLCVGKRKISGIVITVLRFSSDESQVIGGPVNCSNFWALILCKWLKSLELTSRILVRIECTKIAGQILDSSERHCRICLLRSLRFWHIDS